MPVALDPVISTGMAKDPDQRYATTVELANAAHDAITTPVTRPAQRPPMSTAFVTNPVPPTPPTEPAARPQAADLNLVATQQGPADRSPPGSSGSAFSRSPAVFAARAWCVTFTDVQVVRHRA
jgi:serine/threonine-protein kinase